MARADAALLRDNDLLNSLVITDGNDPNRGAVDDQGDACNSNVDMNAMDGCDGGPTGMIGVNGSGVAADVQDSGRAPAAATGRCGAAAAADDRGNVPDDIPPLD